MTPDMPVIKGPAERAAERVEFITKTMHGGPERQAAFAKAIQQEYDSERREMVRVIKSLTASLIACVSAYEAKALKRDAFGTTRLADFNKAIEEGRAAIERMKK